MPYKSLNFAYDESTVSVTIPESLLDFSLSFQLESKLLGLVQGISPLFQRWTDPGHFDLNIVMFGLLLHHTAFNFPWRPFFLPFLFPKEQYKSI